MQKNDIIELDITAMSSEGSGIGRYEGLAVFVPMTALGDKLRVKILKVKSNCAFGKIEEIITPSNSRVESDCEVFSKCGGCVFRHISYSEELKIKQQRVEDAVKRIGCVDKPSNEIVSNLKINGYRNKAQYPISADCSVGFFANHSHRIIPCQNCNLQPEEFSKISAVLTEWMKKSGNTPYTEETGKGLIRHLYIRKAFATGQIMVCLVINGNSLKYENELVLALKELLGEKLKTVVLNINKNKTNVILSDKCKTIFGDGYIYDTLCDTKIRINPLSFYQVNRDMAELLYKKAEEYVNPKDKTVLDLYCGAGTIGLSMAKKAKKIIGVEIIPEAISDAKFNAENNNIQNAEFICGDAKEAANKLAQKGIKPDAVIVDPPRKGCSAELLNIIAKDFCPKTLVYVSCDPATLARDIKILTELGYALKEYTPFDLFPRTSHVETVALMTR
ncbi:MAG: 23S rRNA (uracil(1939)-C(5))-methyltransferase RlmD [Ruminococcaceae bacterium]|nr:23S rRNA (uracil(1939)-C(5))-methyltransferase RlmD [Oscillospiraceae bacterium]